MFTPKEVIFALYLSGNVVSPCNVKGLCHTLRNIERFNDKLCNRARLLSISKPIYCLQHQHLGIATSQKANAPGRMIELHISTGPDIEDQLARF